MYEMHVDVVYLHLRQWCRDVFVGVGFVVYKMFSVYMYNMCHLEWSRASRADIPLIFASA